MRIEKLSKRMFVNLMLIALSILAVPAVKAECGTATHKGSALTPELKSHQEPAAQKGEDFSAQAVSSQARSDEKQDSDVSILGLWKKVYFDPDGVPNDVGFAQFNGGGTELLNDAGLFNAGNNFCMGAWKKVGPRSYDLVHTFFLFDGTNAIGVSIEKSHITVSRDGERFHGTWTQDNYDLSGNLTPGTHFDGTITGTRIAPGLEYPFPLPL